MIPIYQRNWYSECSRLDDGNLLAEVSYLDAMTEKTARLFIERGTLKIDHAEVATCREGTRAVAEPLAAYPEITGIKAYFGCGKPLRDALPGDQLLMDLMIEAVEAVIQAETFFFQETGYPDWQAYNDYWDTNFLNTCVYYSNLEAIRQPFSDYCRHYVRERKLYCRHRRTSVFRLNAEELKLITSFCDTFHDIALAMTLKGQQRLITQAESGILRSPDPICRASLTKLSGLNGKSVLDRATAKICGGEDGCTHISHLLTEAGRTMELAEKESGIFAEPTDIKN